MPRSIAVHRDRLASVYRALEAKGFVTQGDLAFHLGIARSTVNNFFTGKKISIRKFEEICEALELDARETTQPLIPTTEVTVKSTPQNTISPSNTPRWLERPVALAELLEALQSQVRLVVLSGITGVGKTVLATQAIAKMNDGKIRRELTFDDGQMGGAFGVGGALLLRTLGEEPSLEDQKDPENLFAHIVATLRSCPFRLQVDSVERLLQGNEEKGWSEFVDPFWLRLWLQVLREPEFASQVVLTTQALPESLQDGASACPYFCSQVVEGLTGTEQLELFEREGLVETDGEYLQRLGRLMDGHVMMLSVEAAKLKDCLARGGSIAQYWQQTGLDRLEAKEPLPLTGQQWRSRLRWRVQSAIASLPATAQALLCRSSVYQRPVPPQFWVALVPEVPATTVNRVLELLLSRQLAQEAWEPEAWLGQERVLPLRQHNLIRSVAYEQLRGNEEVWRLAEQGAAQQWLKGYEPRSGIEKLETLRGYLEAFDHYCTAEDWDAARTVFLTPLDTPTRDKFYWQLGVWGQYQEQLYLAKTLLSQLDKKTDGTCFNTLGVAYDSLGKYQQAIDFHKQHLEIAQEIGDRQGEGIALGNLGIAYKNLGEYQRAIDFYKQHLEIAQEIGDRQEEGNALSALGLAYNSLGQYQQAIDFHKQHLEIAQEIGDRQGEDNALSALGLVYNSLSEYWRVIDFDDQALTIFREIGDRKAEGNALCHLGIAYKNLGEYQQAIDFHKQHLEIAQEIGDRQGEGIALGNLGIAYKNLGEYQRAINFNKQYLRVAQEIGNRRGEGNSLCNLGITYNKLGQYQRAIDLHEKHLKIAKEIGDRRGEGKAFGNIGNAQVNLGQYDAAIENLKASLTIFQEIKAPDGEAQALEFLAELYYKTNRLNEACDCSTAALALAQRLGIPLAAECEDLKLKIEVAKSKIESKK
jgi:tetratricopeptide (TPR) repeat protein/DNA-binding Xre family transcriptional regulator